MHGAYSVKFSRVNAGISGTEKK
jgi:hypothetical protein